MIWLWIIPAFVLSAIPLIKKDVPLPLYMWLLLPIDVYGIDVSGTIIKPYMIFALILPIIMYAKNKGRDYDMYLTKSQLFAGIISILLVTVSMFNSDNSYSIKAAAIAVVVYICAQISASTTEPTHINKLCDVFIASCFGFGLVFLIADICLNAGFDFPGIIATTREEAGIFMQQSNMNTGELIQVYRLRGFTYDPNIISIQFVFGLAACVLRIFKKPTVMNTLTAVICVTTIILSSSRMGLICCAVCILISSFIGIKSFKTIRQKAVTFVGVLMLVSSLIAIFATNWGESVLSNLISSYTNRSGLNDNYGRFTLWGQSLSNYWNKSPVLGVGFGNMSTISQVHRMSHNTWLELVCECGILVGSITIIYFLYVMISGWTNVKRCSHTADKTNCYTLIIGYTITIIALSSVDNFTNSYLWFSALLLCKLANHTASSFDTLADDESSAISL